MAAVLAVGLAVTYFRRPPAEEAAPVRFSIPPPEKTSFVASHWVSPDGRLLAFRATASGGQTLIHVRPLDSFAARPLPGTEGAIYPFWSADSRFIGFAQQGRLKKIDVMGGPAQSIADGFGVGGSAWNRDGMIVASRSLADVLYRVPAAGEHPPPSPSWTALAGKRATYIPISCRTAVTSYIWRPAASRRIPPSTPLRWRRRSRESES